MLAAPLLKGTSWTSTGGAQGDVTSTSDYVGVEKVTVPAFPNGVEAASTGTGLSELRPNSTIRRSACSGFVGIPVQLKGTTSDPWFMPSKGYLIGAAIGTAVLPVIGTSIGSSLGSRFEGKTDCK